MFKKSSQHKLKKTQDKLLRSIKMIGDITVVEAASGAVESLEPSIELLSEIASSIIFSTDTLSERQRTLLFSSEYLQMSDQETAQFWMQIAPDKQMPLCAHLIDTLLHIRRNALKSGNSAVAQKAFYSLSDILSHSCESPAYYQVCKLILNTMRRELYNIASDDQPDATDLLYRWYFTTVPSDKFSIQYLDLFNEYLFWFSKIMIRSKDNVTMRTFVERACHHHWGWNRYHQRNLYQAIPRDIGNETRHQIYTIINALEEDVARVFSLKGLGDYQARLNRTKEQIKKLLSSDLSNVLEEALSELGNHAKDSLRYHEFIATIFKICSLCLFQSKFSLIRLVWTFKQPPDADATHIGSDIYPDTFGLLCSLYLHLSPRDISFDEGHHGAARYVDQLFLLNALHLLKKTIRKAAPPTPDGDQPNEVEEEYVVPENLLSKYPNSTLGQAEHKVRKLKGFVGEIFKNEKMLMELGLPTGEKAKLALTEFLDQLNKSAEKTLTSLQIGSPLSEQKKVTFGKEVCAAFKKSLFVRRLIDLFGQQEIGPASEEVNKLGHWIYDDRAAFFEDWYVSFGLRDTYGESVARGEDAKVLAEMCKASTPVGDNLDTVIQTLGNDQVVIISSFEPIFDYFERRENFLPEWRVKQSEDLKTGIAELPHFAGFYCLGAAHIPVFQAHDDLPNGKVLVLNKCAIGTFKRIAFSEEELADSYGDDSLIVKIQDMSTNKELRAKALENPPDWLREKEDPEQYLKTRIALELYEKFTYTPDAGLGFLVDVSDKTKLEEA